MVSVVLSVSFVQNTTHSCLYTFIIAYNTMSQTPAMRAQKPYYVLLILTLVYAFNFVDRQIIGILSPLIKADMALTDAQLGYLKGIYFAMLYTLTGIPIAWLADRTHRVNIIAVSLTMWRKAGRSCRSRNDRQPSENFSRTLRGMRNTRTHKKT